MIRGENQDRIDIPKGHQWILSFFSFLLYSKAFREILYDCYLLHFDFVNVLLSWQNLTGCRNVEGRRPCISECVCVQCAVWVERCLTLHILNFENPMIHHSIWLITCLVTWIQTHLSAFIYRYICTYIHYVHNDNWFCCIDQADRRASKRTSAHESTNAHHQKPLRHLNSWILCQYS